MSGRGNPILKPNTDQQQAEKLHLAMLGSTGWNGDRRWPEVLRLQRAGLVRVKALSKHTARVFCTAYVKEGEAL